MAVAIRRLATEELSAAEVERLADLLRAAWPAGEFTDDDLAHAMGGVHWLAEAGDRLVGHASVVPRRLEAAGRPLATGYLEAVAVDPAWRGRGIGARLVAAAGADIRARYELGALSTGVHRLYERQGWERWRGRTFVSGPRGPERTPDEDDGVMVLRTPRTPPLTLSEDLACDPRPGDAW